MRAGGERAKKFFKFSRQKILVVRYYDYSTILDIGDSSHYNNELCSSST